MVAQSTTNRAPAEAGEVWQQRILTSRTAGEKALANADILLICSGRWRSQRASCSIRSLPTTSLKCSRCPLSSLLIVRARSSSPSPSRRTPRAPPNDGRETERRLDAKQGQQAALLCRSFGSSHQTPSRSFHVLVSPTFVSPHPASS